MSEIEDKLITKECYAMREIIIENFTREAKWLYFQMNIVEYLKDNGMNLVADYEQKIADLQSQLDQAKSEITKYMILLNDMETENSHLETMLDQANEKIMWLNAEIDTLKSEKENLMRTLEEAEKKLQELRGGE